MNKFMQGMLFALLIVYVVSPVDLIPGPVDDILAMLLYFAANKGKLSIGKKDEKSEDYIEVIDVDGKEI